MFSNNQQENFESLVAKSADLTNKPFIHSVIKVNGGFDLNAEEIDLTVHILCRDNEGRRLERYDLEMEVFKSNNELVFVLAKLNFPNEPILWCGSKTIWMNAINGKKCNPPEYSHFLENLASRIRSSVKTLFF